MNFADMMTFSLVMITGSCLENRNAREKDDKGEDRRQETGWQKGEGRREKGRKPYYEPSSALNEAARAGRPQAK